MCCWLPQTLSHAETLDEQVALVSLIVSWQTACGVLQTQQPSLVQLGLHSV
ncbi:hypothetical protein ACFLRF_06405 [Candidatus Altiarchaeota archaeon]